MRIRSLAVWCTVVVVLSALPLPVASGGFVSAAEAASPGGQDGTAGTAEAAVARTPWGHPDLQGVWDFRTITPLERPEELGERAFLTDERAAGD